MCKALVSRMCSLCIDLDMFHTCSMCTSLNMSLMHNVCMSQNVPRVCISLNTQQHVHVWVLA